MKDSRWRCGLGITEEGVGPAVGWPDLAWVHPPELVSPGWLGRSTGGAGEIGLIPLTPEGGGHTIREGQESRLEILAPRELGISNPAFRRSLVVRRCTRGAWALSGATAVQPSAQVASRTRFWAGWKRASLERQSQLGLRTFVHDRRVLNL